MLNIQEVEALTLLLAARNGAKGLSKESVNTAWETVQASLLASTSARAAQSTAAAQRHAANPNANAGRPPSQWYSVSLGSLWEAYVLGTSAAVEMVNEELAQHKMPLAKVGSLTVSLSKNGQWYRAIHTDNGRYDLCVKKIKPPTE